MCVHLILLKTLWRQWYYCDFTQETGMSEELCGFNSLLLVCNCTTETETPGCWLLNVGDS